jgi:glycosyltransferase involved in cell wall biosynthesis
VLENMFVAIVPAYNEEKHIGSVVRSLLKQVDRIVVVDDGSSDSTAKEAESAGAIVICHEINRGQGAAIETGHEYARLVGADYVLHFDADGQFDTNDIKPALTSLKEKKSRYAFGFAFFG